MFTKKKQFWQYGKLSIESLLEESKSVALEIYEFEYRKITALFENFGHEVYSACKKIMLP